MNRESGDIGKYIRIALPVFLKNLMGKLPNLLPARAQVFYGAGIDTADELSNLPEVVVDRIAEQLGEYGLSEADKMAATEALLQAVNRFNADKYKGGYEAGQLARHLIELADGNFEENVQGWFERLTKGFCEWYLEEASTFLNMGPAALQGLARQVEESVYEIYDKIDAVECRERQRAWRGLFSFPKPSRHVELGLSAITAKSGFIPYTETPMLRELISMAEEVQKSNRLQLVQVVGSGGAGKTRTAIELGRALYGAGWDGGFLRDSTLVGAVDFFESANGPVFAILDYAGSRIDQLKTFLAEAAEASYDKPLFVLLLERNQHDEILKELTALSDPNNTGLPDWIAWRELRYEKAPIKDLSKTEAQTIYRDAYRKLAELSGARAKDNIDELAGQAVSKWRKPLHITLSALLEVAGIAENAPDEGALIKEALDYEVGRWIKRGLDNPPGQHAKPWYELSFKRLAAVGTLAGALPVEEARNIVRSACILQGAAAEYVRGVEIADALGDMLPCAGVGKECIGALEPDPIADYMLSDLLEQDNFECLIEAALPPEDLEDDAQFFARVKHVANVLARAFNQSQAYKMLRPILMDKDPKYAVRVWEIMERWEGGGREELRLDPNAPLVTHVLFSLVLPVVAGYGKKLSGETMGEEEQADLFLAAGNDLAVHGHYHEALELVQKATELYQQLAEESPTRFLPDLAASLNNLANIFFALGHNQDALEAAQQALELRQQLAGQNPSRFLPELAGSLNNLASFLSGLGHHQEALDHAERAVELYRRLAGDNSTHFLPDLARSLNNLAVFLSNLGRPQKALEVAERAVELRRQLAGEYPGGSLSELATSLNNLANTLSDLGRYQDALEPAQKAVELYQQLAGENPDRFLPDLALGLNNLANTLSDLGGHQEALDHAERAAEIYQQLASENPTRFNPDLAGALGLTSHILDELGRRQEAFSKAEDGLRKLRDHFFHFPQAYAGLMDLILTDYENARRHCGCEPDLELVIPIIEKLQELQG